MKRLTRPRFSALFCAAPASPPPSLLTTFQALGRTNRKEFPLLFSFFLLPVFRPKFSFLMIRVEKNVLFVLPEYVSIRESKGYWQEKSRTLAFWGTSVSPAFPAWQEQRQDEISCLSCQSPAKVLLFVASNSTEQGANHE